MTAPIAPVPAAPVAPAVPVGTLSLVPPQRTFGQAIAAVAGNTGIAPDAPTPQPPVVQITRDPPAPVVAEPVAAPIEGAPVETAAATEPPAIPVVPELSGEVTLDDGEMVLTAERNADGTFKAKIDPSQKFDLKIVDKETGEAKVYTKTLPELMRMAKDGVWGQKVRDEVTFYRENIPVWEQTHQTLQAQLDDQRALNRELLSAPDDIVIERREAFAAEMTPQKQLERARAEHAQERDALLAERQAQERTRTTQQAQSFIQARLAPAIKDAEAKLGVHAVAGAIAIATAPLLVNGQIPPNRWPQVEAYINGPFKQWVATEAAKHSRTKADSDAAIEAKRAADAAQRQAQSVVNEAGRAMAPIGRAAPDAPPSLPKPKTAKEAVDRMIHRPLPSSVQSVAG